MNVYARMGTVTSNVSYYEKQWQDFHDAALAPPQLLAAPQLRRAERRAPLDPELDERLRVEAQPRRPPRRRREVGLELARVLVEPREPALRRAYDRSADRVV